jgi:hypothetical protein
MNVLITLTSAGVDTGPFNLYSNVDSYTTAFETDISRGILVAGYTSTIVPPGTSAIRVKSMGVCTNYVDITIGSPSTTTTTTTASSGTTTTTSTTTAAPGTTTTTTTAEPVPTTTTTTTYIGPATTTTTSTTATPTTTTTTTAGGGTTTTTTTSGGDTTTTTTSTSTSTTSTTTTSIFVSCQEWRNDTAGEVIVTYTPCGSDTPVSGYAVATTSSICAVFGSVTVTSGDPLTEVGSCSEPTTTTSTTTTATPTTTTTTTLLYYQYSLCTDSNVQYYTANSGYPSMILIAGQCFVGGSSTTSPQGTEFFANDGTCDCG